MTNQTCTIVVCPEDADLKEEDIVRMARAYGCFKYVEGWDGNEAAIQRGYLLTTHITDPTSSEAIKGRSFDFPVRVVTYKVAMEMVKIDEEGRA